MFRMTSSIKIGAFKPVKANAVRWERSLDNYSDTATIVLPAIAMLKKDGDRYERVQAGNQFKEGMQVSVSVGYDGRNRERFKGFIRRINFKVPLELECEGYAWQLRKKLDYSKSYSATTVKKILEDLIEGTDITLSKDIPNIPIPKAVFKNVTGLQVLDFLKEKCLLSAYFTGSELYVGLSQLQAKGVVKYRLGWNVIKDDELKFNDEKELANVRIKITKRGKDGKVKPSFYGPKDGQVVEKRIQLIDDEATIARIAEEQKRKLAGRGYEGSITTFLEPYCEPGMTAAIDDLKYPARKSNYLIVGEKGSFSSAGGRVSVKIGNTL